MYVDQSGNGAQPTTQIFGDLEILRSGLAQDLDVDLGGDPEIQIWVTMSAGWK